MSRHQYNIGWVIPVALILFFGVCPAQSLICYSCTGCYGAPTSTTSSGSICMTYNATCVAGSISSTSLGLSTTSFSSLCGSSITPYTTTTNGVSTTCSGIWTCCYTNYCNTCPSAGCTYTSTGTGSSDSNNSNVQRMSVFGSLMLAIILTLTTIYGYKLNMQ